MTSHQGQSMKNLHHIWSNSDYYFRSYSILKKMAHAIFLWSTAILKDTCTRLESPKDFPYWGQVSSGKRSRCERHGLSNILKLQATFMYSIYHQRAGKTNLFHMRGGWFLAFNTWCTFKQQWILVWLPLSNQHGGTHTRYMCWRRNLSANHNPGKEKV